MTNFQKVIEALNQPLTYLNPVEWAEKYRVLTPDITNWPGPMMYNRTPYLKEIANTIMPDCPAQYITVMKGSQIGFSIGGIFSMMGWVISESPGNMLFIVNDDEGLRRAMQGPIDQMINSSGIGHLIKAQNVRGGRNQKTGDTIKGKSFPGGNLYTWSGQSIGKLSQISVKYGFYDEVERYILADKESGSFFRLIEQRHKSFSTTKKLYFISTPEIKQTSRIEPLYLKGDQRKYHIPCKKCGELIELIWYQKSEKIGKNVGVTFERNEFGELKKKSVKYTCQKCGGTFNQVHVYECYDKDFGKWIPTAKPLDEKYRSYHISALYAPAGMDDWGVLAQKWCEIHPYNQPVNIDELKAFINQDLGQTWEDQKKSINIKSMSARSRNYKPGVVPNKLSEEDGNGSIIAVTCACDLNGFEDDGRLDYEIVGWSEAGPSYSIDHGSIGTFERGKSLRNEAAKRHAEKEKKRIKWNYYLDSENSIWEKYAEILKSPLQTDDESEDVIWLSVCDVGQFTDLAYQFIDTIQQEGLLVYGVRGIPDSKERQIGANNPYFTISKEIDSLYNLDTNLIKDHFARAIETKWHGKGRQPYNYCNFPKPNEGKYTDKQYYTQLKSEEKREEKNDIGQIKRYAWQKKHSSVSNHYLDCKVYNIGARDILYRTVCKENGLKQNEQSWNVFCNLVKS